MSNNDISCDHICFDLDGTLVESIEELHLAACRMADELDLSHPSAEQIRLWVGNGVPILVARILNQSMDAEIGDQELWGRAYERFVSHYDAISGTRACLFPGVRHTLEALIRKGFKLSLVTNKPRQATQRLLHKLEIDEFFAMVIGGDTLPVHKPDPALFHHLASHLQFRRSVMVGDSATDVRFARNVGIPVIAVSYGYNHGRPIHECSPDLVIDHLEELIGHITFYPSSPESRAE